MARLSPELKALEVQRLTRAGRHPVGVVPGLYLQVREPNESSQRSCRTWVLRAMVGGRRRDLGLGGYPAVTLAQAHQKAREARDLIAKGIDPVAAKRESLNALAADKAGAATFERAAAEYIDTHEAS